MPRKKPSNSIEKALAAKLQAEVDIAVLRVREAADKAVQAFEDYAVRIATGEVPNLPVPQVRNSQVVPFHVEPVEDLPAHMRPPADEELPSRTVTDAYAVSANMSAYR